MADPSAPPIGSAAWLDAMLREQLGPEAAAGTISFEGKRLRINGARLPFGGAVLAVEEAEVALGEGAPLGPLPISARLVSLRGELSMASLRVPIALAGVESAAPAWFSGSIRASVTGLAIELVAVEVSAAGMRLSDGNLMAGSTAITVNGMAARRDDGSISADLALATERSSLALSLAVDPGGGTTGSRLTGRLALADALAVIDTISPHPVPLGITPGPESALDLDLAADGPIASPSLRGRVFSAAIDLGRGAARAGACRFENISAVIESRSPPPPLPRAARRRVRRAPRRLGPHPVRPAAAARRGRPALGPLARSRRRRLHRGPGLTRRRSRARRARAGGLVRLPCPR
ncbi:MAG: hypothetical protein QM820_64260 [Minicystis sp.]